MKAFQRILRGNNRVRANIVGLLGVTMATLLISSAAVRAQKGGENPDQQLKTLKQEMKERAPKLLQFKNQGKIGETFDGTLGIVGDPQDVSSKVKKLVQAENRDRQKVYKLIAEKVNANPQQVARQNGLRNFKLAPQNHYLKFDDREWARKKNLPPINTKDNG